MQEQRRIEPNQIPGTVYRKHGIILWVIPVGVLLNAKTLVAFLASYWLRPERSERGGWIFIERRDEKLWQIEVKAVALATPCLA